MRVGRWHGGGHFTKSVSSSPCSLLATLSCRSATSPTATLKTLLAQERYEDCWQRLEFDPPSWSSSERAETRRELAATFGPVFLNPRGWAEPLFGHAPTMRELEERADLDQWRVHYDLASDPVHAGARGSLWSVQVLGDSTVMVAGPSNAGLDEAGQLCAITLMNITVGLLVKDLTEFSDPAEQLEHAAETSLGTAVVATLARKTVECFVQEGRAWGEEEVRRRALSEAVASALRDESQVFPCLPHGWARNPPKSRRSSQTSSAPATL